MNNDIKFQYIKERWELRDGIVYSKRTGGPVAFPGKNRQGHRFTSILVNGKKYNIRIHETIYMLHHDRAISEDKEIHHIDNDPENNAIINLVELTDKQHMRIHKYQCSDPMRGITLDGGAWRFRWLDDDGKHRSRRFHGINDAMTFRDTIERPRRQELRALGLNCKKEYRGVTASQLRKISRKQNSRLWRTHI